MAGVYLSWPFCGQKCTYCNFASGVLPREWEPRYEAALLGELRRFSWPWTPQTVYLGGGSPSRMSESTLAALLGAIPGAPWCEATLEAAPGEITPERAASWHALGITRASLGTQSFVVSELRRTGRRHTPQLAADDVATLRAAGITNINLDLICGLPGQTRGSWETSLDWIERLHPPHVSVYMLEVDEDSRLGLEILNHGSRYGAHGVPSDDLQVELYERAVERLRGLGIERYEISNFARPGFESRHNLKYWRLEPYAGFGADAHSCSGGMRWQNAEPVAAYLEAMEAGRSPRTGEHPADPAAERFFVGLRLSAGVTVGAEDEDRYGERFRSLQNNGLLERSDTLVRLTSRGVMLSNEVFQEFLPS
ncbi:MAG: radical SAM family heme chaperone HemW [Bryobacterales bacterium]|nr:radical SAM family heme chaperone HemW [Bryobacterales bacterium]